MAEFIHKICEKPFEEIEIHENGEVYFCCPHWNDFYSIGNIFNDTSENIWNSEKAIEFRKRILNEDYSLCNIDCCHLCKNKWFKPVKNYDTPVMKDYPIYVKLVYDEECNIACKICRGKVFKYSEEKLNYLNEKMYSYVLPLLKSAKTVYLNGHGDAFGSRHSINLMKNIIKNYPETKLDIQTNGVLCSEKIFKSINLTSDRIFAIRISISAATKETYGKMVLNGERYFDIIIENIKFLKKLQQNNDFEIFIHFVVTSDNYQEIPDFIRLIEKLGTDFRIWEYRKSQTLYDLEEDLEVSNPSHKDHSNLLNVLKDDIVIKYKNKFSPVLSNLIS